MIHPELDIMRQEFFFQREKLQKILKKAGLNQNEIGEKLAKFDKDMAQGVYDTQLRLIQGSLNKIKISEPTRKLQESANAKWKTTIPVVPSNVPKATFDWDTKAPKVNINLLSDYINDDDDVFNAILFELLNADGKPVLDNLYKDANLGNVSAMDYALQFEYFEYINAVKQAKLSPGANNFTSFDGYLGKQIAKHTSIYVKAWHDRYQGEFAVKHPKQVFADLTDYSLDQFVDPTTQVDPLAPGAYKRVKTSSNQIMKELKGPTQLQLEKMVADTLKELNMK